MINNEKTEITILGDTYKLDNIELIYTQKKHLYVCVGCKVIRCLCENSAKTFNEIATQILLSGKENFIILLSGNNLVNVNKVKTISKDGDLNLKIETKHHLYTLKDSNFMDYMILADKVNQAKQNQDEITK